MNELIGQLRWKDFDTIASFMRRNKEKSRKTWQQLLTLKFIPLALKFPPSAKQT